jgi:hypothetical protein
MNRIARGMVVFTSKGVLRLLGVPKEVIPPVELPKPAKNKIIDKSAKPLAIAGATTALIYASSDEKFRATMKKAFQRGIDAYKTERRAHERTRSSGTSSSNGNGSSGSSNGSRLSKMTRGELYKLAQQKDIAGRSSMSKAQLKNALS